MRVSYFLQEMIEMINEAQMEAYLEVRNLDNKGI